MKLITSRSRTYGIHICGTVSAWWCHAPPKVWEMHFLKHLAMLWAQPFRPEWNRTGLIWSEHLLSLVFAGHINSWFSLALHFTHSLISFILILCPCQTTALDKERQVFRRRRNQDVRGRYKEQQAPPELNSESEDYSPSSSETVRSPNSPF